MEEILSHKWFEDIDRAKLLAKELEPPYVPNTNAELAYFDKNLVKQNATEVADTMLTPAQQQIVKSDPN